MNSYVLTNLVISVVILGYMFNVWDTERYDITTIHIHYLIYIIYNQPRMITHRFIELQLLTIYESVTLARLIESGSLIIFTELFNSGRFNIAT